IHIELKIQIIKDLEAGKSQEAIAKKYKVRKTTVFSISKRKDEFRRLILKYPIPACGRTRRALKMGDFCDIEEPLYRWYQLRHNNNLPVSGSSLKEKALQLYKSTYADGTQRPFMASRGWLNKFCRRYGIIESSLQPNSWYRETQEINRFITEVQEIIKSDSFSKQQIFSVDEKILRWKTVVSPNPTGICTNKNNPKIYRRSKAKLTLLACTNASGTYKLPLAVVDKNGMPSTLDEEQVLTLPVTYYRDEDLRMCNGLYESWYNDQFKPRVKRFCKENNFPSKVLLLVRDTPAHNCITSSISDSEKFIVLRIPSNIAFALQPMNQGILTSLESHYQTKLYDYVIHKSSEKKKLILKIMSKLTVKDAIFWLSDSWNEVSSSFLRKCWNHI
ncbi:uncharacterized protein TRIADDRAFT_2637, partial [Trichoplax adhaerens]